MGWLAVSRTRGRIKKSVPALVWVSNLVLRFSTETAIRIEMIVKGRQATSDNDIGSPHSAIMTLTQCV